MTERSISGEFDPGPEREAELVEQNMRKLHQRVADRAVYAAAVATAGTVQALVAEVGGFDRVREHDLVAAWRASLAAQPGTGLVVCEHRSGLPTHRGAWDIAIVDSERERPVEVAEMKWDRSDKLHEVLWDTIKIASALASDLDGHRALERGLIVMGAPTFDGLREDLQPVVDTGAWTAGAIVSERPRIWRWACGSSAPPTQTPSGIALRRVASVPILGPTAEAAPWELRVLEVSVTDRTPTAVSV